YVLQTPMLDLSNPSDRSSAAPGADVIFFGFPLVVGAKRGFPNFNEFAMQTRVLVSRLLEFRRAAGDTIGPVIETNQMYVIGISNVAGIESWNSYSNPYPRNLQLIVVADLTAVLTNEVGAILLTNRVFSFNVTNIGSNTWLGWTNAYQPPSGFLVPLTTNF